MDPRPTDANSPHEIDEGWLDAHDGLRLYRRSFTPADAEATKAHVLIVHGYGEHLGRYRETMERLGRAGYATHAYDYRGHGKSGGVRAHVEAFGHYLADLDLAFAFARDRAQKDGAKKVFLLGHSLGGLITARWLLGRTEGVAGAILSSPFMALAFEPARIKTMAASLLDVLAPRFRLSNELKYEQLTRDEAIRKATRADPLYQKVTTPRWFKQTGAAQAETLTRAKEITVPCLVLVGEADPIASPAAAKKLFAGLGSARKTLKAYDGFLHEVLNEVGRDAAFADIVAFIDHIIGEGIGDNLGAQ